MNRGGETATGTGLERRGRTDCCRAGGVDLSGTKDAVVYVRQNGVTLRTAPWRMGILDKVGVRIKHGTRYILRAGSVGPSCAVARKKLAHIVRLRTRKAIRAASFGGLDCEVGQRDLNILWVRPLGAWAGCWTVPNQPIARYFFWELNST